MGLMTSNHQHAKVSIGKVLANVLKIIGSYKMEAFRYPEKLEVIKNGKLHPEKPIEKTFSLGESTFTLPNMNEFDNKGVWIIISF